MDIKGFIDSIVAALQWAGLVPRPDSMAAVDKGSIAAAGVTPEATSVLPNATTILVLLFVVGGLAYLARTSVGRRAQAGVSEAIFTNWRLGLLGATGLVLSLASGWTTWDGMRNFTGEPVLSLMVTFGIQGVMLIVAWLIGESFATGMNQSVRSNASGLSRAAQTVIGSLLGILFAIAVLALLMSWSGVLAEPGVVLTDPTTWAATDKLLFLAIGLVGVAAILIFQRDVLSPYFQGTTVILRNMVLWVMFLACMGTSVFFSFDSLFSVIFPAQERQRAADIRSINQVSGVVSDIGALITRRRNEEAKNLFSVEGWTSYEKQLEAAERLGRKAPDEVRQQMERELTSRKQRLAELEEKKASAKSGEAGLTTRKVQITEELSRLEAQRPEAASAAAQQKAVVTDIEKRLDEQRAKVLAEEKGVEGSGKVGRGQFWRAAKAEETKIRSELQVARQRLDSHAGRLDGLTTRIAAIKRELASIDGDIAKYKGEAQTADQIIDVARNEKTSELGLESNPVALVAQMSRDLDSFRFNPQEDTLARIQEQCQLLVTTSQRVESLRNDATAVDCDPKRASQAAALVFALNRGAAAFASNCAGGEKLPQAGGTDALLSFGRKCLQDSGLPSRDSSAMAGKLSSIDLMRDDKAHRFVVTWNAFSDGNRLAYLALALAIAIDSLVFMSGLFGANAVRSPLSDVPTSKARSARQLESIIDAALMPHSFETARMVLSAMKPMTQRDGFMARVTLYDNDPHSSDIRRVLNAGATIGGVRHIQEDDRVYEIRAELFEYLSHVAKREFEANKEHANIADLERTVSVALLPNVHQNVEVVLLHLHPIEDNPTFFEKVGLQGPHGFVSEINMGDISEAEHKRIVRSVLNAGATADAVQRVDPKHYYIHRDLYKTLVRIRARMLLQAPESARLAPPARYGGHLAAASDGLVRPAEPMRLNSPVTPQLRRTSESDANRLESYLATLLSALGVSSTDFAEITGETLDAALGASEAFRRVQRSNKLFDQIVRERETYALQALKRAYDKAAQPISKSDSFELRLLEEAYQDIVRNFAIVALLPNGPFSALIDEIVIELEPQGGAGELEDVEEQGLLRLGRSLQRVLRNNPRSDSASWNRLHLELADSPQASSAAQLAEHTAKRTYN